MHLTRRGLSCGLSASIVALPLSKVGAAADPITIEASPAKLRLRQTPAPETDVLAYNGTVPGPLIRVRLGESVRIRFVNKLAEPTTLSWHGVRIPNAMDGVAGLTQPPVPPGGTFDYAFKPPDAGLYWYHPHALPTSATQIRRGLYGVLLVEERTHPSVDHDVVAVIGDWSLDGKAQADGRTAGPDALITVNGRPAPLVPSDLPPGARIRFRLLNACGSRIIRATLAGMDASIVAIDGQPSELFPPAGGTIPIGPGARFELIGDLPRIAAKTVTLGLRGEHDAELPLLRFSTKGAPVAPRPPVERLAPNLSLPTRIPLERSLKRELLIAASADAKGAKPTPSWTINGKPFGGYAGKPLFQVKRGSAVTLAFVNKSAEALQMHVHGHVFRVLHDLDDGWDPYWRESLLIAPGKTKHVAFVADNPGKWALESLILEQQTAGLAGWFAVA